MSLPFDSPYLATHKEYLSLLGSKAIHPGYQGQELWRLTIYSRGYVVFHSGFIGASQLDELQGEIPTHDKVRVKASLDLTFIHSRGHFSRRVWLQLPKFPKGKPRLRLPSLSRGYPRAKSHLRTWARSQVSPRSRAAVKVPRSSDLRPSPETVNSVFPSVHETNRDPLNGSLGPVITTVTPRSKLVTSRVWTGVRTPHFGDLKKGQLPENPHSMACIEVMSNISVSGNYEIGGPRYELLTDLYTSRYAEPSWPSHLMQARNKAISKIMDKADLGVDANIPQDLAQIHQVFSLIGDNAGRIFDSLKNLRRGNIPAAIHSLTAGRSHGRVYRRRPNIHNTLANNWLELQYGWKPFLQDIEGVLKSLPHLFEDTGFVQTVSESGTVSDETRINGLNASFQTGQKPVRWIQYSTRTTCRLKLRFKLANGLKAFLAQTGFTNPINLAWEILPFSFVADWCLPIGPYLEACTAFDGYEFLDGSQTLFTKRVTTSAVDNAQVSDLNSGTSVFETSRYSDEKVLLDRTKLLAFPSPTFPSFKNPFKSVEHAANGIALLVSAFKR